MNMLILSPQQPSDVFSSHLQRILRQELFFHIPNIPQLSGGAATIAHFNQVLEVYRVLCHLVALITGLLILTDRPASFQMFQSEPV